MTLTHVYHYKKDMISPKQHAITFPFINKNKFMCYLSRDKYWRELPQLHQIYHLPQLLDDTLTISHDNLYGQIYKKSDSDFRPENKIAKDLNEIKNFVYLTLVYKSINDYTGGKELEENIAPYYSTQINIVNQHIRDYYM